MKIKTQATWARLAPIEKQALQAIREREQLNESEAVRFIIRHYAKQYGLWPVVTCPECDATTVENIGDNGQFRCLACGHHFAGA